MVPAANGANASSQLEGAESFISSWKGHALVTPTVAPHSPYTTSAWVYRKSKEIADKYKAPTYTTRRLSETAGATARPTFRSGS